MAAALREAIGEGWQATDRRVNEGGQAVARAQLDDAAFAAAWPAGR